jgi:hypothetical protein
MAITIFLMINGLGVAFLLYVLANFWKEDHRPKSGAPKYAAPFARRDWTDSVVVTHPVSHSAQAGISVIPFQSRRQESYDQSSRGPMPNQTVRVPVRRISTR